MSLSSIAIGFLWATLCYETALVVYAVLAMRSANEDQEFSDIKIWLEGLLKNGFDGETILFRDQRKRRFIRFRKYAGSSGAAGIELTFPELSWGQELLPELNAFCESNGLRLAPSDAGEPSYACVMVGSALHEAYALCQTIWTKFYGFSEHAKFDPEIGDLSTIDELVGGISQSELSSAERNERYVLYMNARLRHAGIPWLQGTSSLRVGGSLVLLVFATVVFLTSLVALPISTLAALGDPPGWQLDLGQVTLRGSTASLASFVAYFLSFEGVRRFQRFRLVTRQRMTRAERFLRTPSRIILASLPIAVVMVWLGN